MRRALPALLWLAMACEPSSRRADEPPRVAPAATSGGMIAAAASATTTAKASAAAGSSAVAKSPLPPPLSYGGKHSVQGKKGMVSSEDAIATKVGARILEQGGNAVDAAVAVAYALSVTHHSAGSLGGGGFMIVRLASGEVHAVDYREVAPAKATVKLNDKQLAAGAHGYLSAPVPGVVAGLELAREKLGTMQRDKLVAPAIELAERGHPYGVRQAQSLAWLWKKLRKDPVLRAIFGRGPRRDKPVLAGQLVKQPALGKTLRAIAKHGREGFYEGEVAARIVKAMKNRGGLVTAEDLAAYRAKLRQPLHLRYRGFDVYTMAPPSMGGVAVLSILRGLESVPGSPGATGSARSLHLFVEAARRAYANRRLVGADPDFFDRARVEPLLARLIGPAATPFPVIDMGHATASSKVVPLDKLPPSGNESPDTTHFSVIDAQGNAVSCTTTLSAAFGAWVVIPETGVLPSNAMGGFSPAGVNALKPGKRMASSMSPSIVVRGGQTVAVVGSPGGDTIPNTVAQVIRNLIDFRMPVDLAVEETRVHHQYQPDVVRLEKQRLPSAATLRELGRLGHVLKPSPIPIGDANVILRDPDTGTTWGYADSRKGGLALGPN